MPHQQDGLAALQQDLDQKETCDFRPEKKAWRANLSGSSEVLGDHLGGKPRDAARESELTARRWPSQAHHLIPHLQLADHAVADWLKEGDLLYGDTRYDVDHRNNGVWLPYASSLAEWDEAGPKKKRALMFKVMGLSGLQLHQGPHSRKNRYGVGLAPYKKRVEQYLAKIDDHCISHYAGKPPCKDCSAKKEKGKYPPRDNTVRHVDRASRLLLGDLEAGRIFVSRIAAEFAQTAE